MRVIMKAAHLPLVPANAGTQSQEKKELDSRFRENERSWLLVLSVIAAVFLAPMLALPARADVNEIKIGKQYGLPYIQFVIMEDKGLIEKRAKQEGLGDIKVNWATLGGPAAINDGIISGAI